jgi:hypothetical protein
MFKLLLMNTKKGKNSRTFVQFVAKIKKCTVVKLSQITYEFKTLLRAQAASILLHDPDQETLIFSSIASEEESLLLGTRIPHNQFRLSRHFSTSIAQKARLPANRQINSSGSESGSTWKKLSNAGR